MELKSLQLFFVLFVTVLAEHCPKECDCDANSDGLNRATCVDQHIVSIDVGVPKSVQVYSLSHNAISELDNFCFKEVGFTSLQTLDLSYNLIFWIGIHAFAGLEQLSHLDLSNNRLRQIPSDLFWDTAELDTLDLSANVFETLKNEPFIMHSKLQVLNLNNCRIKALPDRLFTRLPKLKKIDLSENYMVSLNIEVLRPLRRLQRIELRNEYWKCDTEYMKVETWIISRGIQYQKQCKQKTAKMSEKMISLVTTEREDVDIDKVWQINITNKKNIPEVRPDKDKPLTPFEKFDKEFSSTQAFIIGLELGLAIGVVGTYIWLRAFCKCGQLNCSRIENRRIERRRARLADSDMRANLLWSTVVNPDLETPPTYRRQISLPDRGPPFPRNGLPSIAEAELQVDAIRLSNRPETPPPPYNECRVNLGGK